jgi:hypothetical protein
LGAIFAAAIEAAARYCHFGSMLDRPPIVQKLIARLKQFRTKYLLQVDTVFYRTGMALAKE